MNFLTTTEFRSKLFPEVSFKLRIVTVGRRIEYFRAQTESNGNDFEWRKSNRALWKTLVLDFDGIETDGSKPSVDDLFLNGPEELITEVSRELVRMATPLGATDSSDESIIELAEQQIAEARMRIEARKNSEPQSSGPTVEAVTRTAADAPAIQTKPEPFASEGIVMANLGT
jgi:hypothetical protein